MLYIVNSDVDIEQVIQLIGKENFKVSMGELWAMVTVKTEELSDSQLFLLEIFLSNYKVSKIDGRG